MKDKIHITILQEPMPRRKSSFWFRGEVATLKLGSRTVTIEAQGDIRVMFEPNGNCYNNESATDEAINRGYTDRKLNTLNNHDGWGNNNWFEMFLDYTPTKSEWEKTMNNVKLWKGKLKEYLKYKKSYRKFVEDFSHSDWADAEITFEFNEAISYAKEILKDDEHWKI